MINELLLNKYGKYTDHALQVRNYALMVFDAMNNNIFYLTDKEKNYLTTASLLHDIGYRIDSKSHHKHSMQMIMDMEIEEYTETEKQIVANIARYHRGALPDITKHELYAKLSSENRTKVNILASILRLADGMDKPHKNLITKIEASQNEKEIIFSLKTLGFKLNLEMTEAKKELMEKTFNKKVTFTCK